MTDEQHTPDADTTSGGDDGRMRIDGEWRRVSPKYLGVEVVSSAITLVVLVAGSIVLIVLGLWIGWPALVAAALIGGLLLAFAPRRVRAIGYQLRADDLVFARGIMFHRVVSVPYGRMQLIDINRGPVARALGLAELKFVTAAASTGVSIPGLPESEANALRDELVALAESRRAGL